MADNTLREATPNISLPGDSRRSVASVERLFLTSGPAAITRSVRTVVVDALNGVLRSGAHPHIGEEVGKGQAPSVANGDTSASVVSPLRRVGIEASCFHS